MQHTSHHGNWMGRLWEMEPRQWEELHWSCSLLCHCHGPCLLLPGSGFVSYRLTTLITSCQRGEKERRDGRRKAVVLMRSAFKFIYWEMMACIKLRFSNFAWWVFNTQETNMLTGAIISRRWQKKINQPNKKNATHFWEWHQTVQTLFSQSSTFISNILHHYVANNWCKELFSRDMLQQSDDKGSWKS